MSAVLPMAPRPGGRAPHLVVAAAGTAGDMYPYLHLARGLIARGHHTSFLGPAAHAGLAAAAGVPYTGLGTPEDYAAALEDPDLWHPRRGFEVIWRHSLPGLDALPQWFAALPADEPCALLAHPLALAAAALVRARRPGLRIVTAWLAPANLRTVHGPLRIGPLRIPSWVPNRWRQALWRLIDATVIDRVALPALDAAHAAARLPPVAHFIDHLQAVPDASLALFPPWFGPPMPDWPPRLREGAFPLYDPHAGAPIDTELDRFLARGDADPAARPVVFTPGSGNVQAQARFAQALAAVRRLGCRAIFLTPHRAQVPRELPADVLWHPYVSLQRLLPRAAALVHHGGIGTTAQALRAGVPQLVLPLAFDQFDNGARVEALGAGRMLTGWRARAGGLARTIDGLLHEPATTAGGRDAAARMAADTAIDLVGRLEALLVDVPEASARGS